MIKHAYGVVSMCNKNCISVNCSASTLNHEYVTDWLPFSTGSMWPTVLDFSFSCLSPFLNASFFIMKSRLFSRRRVKSWMFTFYIYCLWQLSIFTLVFYTFRAPWAFCSTARVVLVEDQLHYVPAHAQEWISFIFIWIRNLKNH